ncbi:MAG: hypothetical protein ABIT37_24495 [Luteolibacter sp.]
MKNHLLGKISLTFAVCLLGVTSAFSAPYEKGQRVESFQAKDQFDNAFTFKPKETSFLLVTTDMETGKKANGALTALGKDFLVNKKAVYLANINGMPAIGRMFAIPKMKKYTHRIILGDDAALIARFPEQAGKVSVLALTDGKVDSVKYWTPGAEGVDTYLK